MTKKETEAYRQKLLTLGKKLEGVVADLSEEALRRTGGEDRANLSGTPLHLADVASDHMEHETAIQLLGNEQQIMGDINAALRRIDEGTYGQCEECGKNIPKERLNIVPYARNCVPCAEEIEKAGGR